MTVAERPTEDALFEVNCRTINWKLFYSPRKDESQERTRRYILEAREKLIKHPKKYGHFYTMMPEKIRSGASKAWTFDYPKYLGGV